MRDFSFSGRGLVDLSAQRRFARFSLAHFGERKRIDGKVVAAIQREAAPGEFRANIHRGGTASVIKPTPQERALAVKAAKVLGLAFAGVDIIRSDAGPLLLEVNSSPGLEGIETESVGCCVVAVGRCSCVSVLGQSCRAKEDNAQ